MWSEKMSKKCVRHHIFHPDEFVFIFVSVPAYFQDHTIHRAILSRMEGLKWNNPKQPDRSEQVIKSDLPDPSRRRLLGAFLGAATLTAAGVAGYEYYTHSTDPDKIKEEPPAPVTPEKIDHIKRSQERIHAYTESLRARPFMREPLRAKKRVENVSSRPDFRSAIFAVGAGSEMTTLHVPNVSELGERTGNDKGKGVYVHTENRDTSEEKKYIVTLADTHTDIGVSNRFHIAKKNPGQPLGNSLPIYAVRRARYEKKKTGTKTIRNKQGKLEHMPVWTGNYVEYITYIPPSKELTTKESIIAGKEYIETVLREAYDILAERMTTSNKNVLRICHTVCKRLAVIEHVDPILFARTEDNKEKQLALFQRMYAEYGLNQENAFNHLINSEGAGGMMQIIPETYQSIRAELIQREIFRSEELPKDENVGRRDPLISSIISIYLCYSNYLVKGHYLKDKSPEEIEWSLVVMYNGSPNLFRKIIDPHKPKSGKQSGKQPAKTEKLPPIPYTHTSPLILKLLTHNKGKLLPGQIESENRNYLRKYIASIQLEKHF
jgi:hypothetical protein